MTFISLLLAAIFALLISGTESVPDDRMSIFSGSNGLFSANLYNAIDKKGNFLISPVSINYALSAVAFGADGDSLHQLRTVLNQPNDDKAIIASYKSFTDSIHNSSNCVIASNMYVDNKFQLKESFKNVLLNQFDSGIENTDFANHPEDSRKTINEFVEKKTNNLIKNLFEAGTITQNTVSVIVNALYFKAAWNSPFYEENTSKKTFYGLENEYQIDMMHRPFMNCLYGEDDELNAQLLELPYKEDFSFFIILPKGKRGIEDVEKNLLSKVKDSNTSPFNELFKKTYSSQVHVAIPKFKFSQTHKLVPTLEKMGIKDIFNSKANFNRMTDSPVFVNDIVHKTYISVYEKGTEAAAATGVEIVPLSATLNPPKVTADHPFIYAIKHHPSNTAIFIGRFSQP